MKPYNSFHCKPRIKSRLECPYAETQEILAGSLPSFNVSLPHGHIPRHHEPHLNHFPISKPPPSTGLNIIVSSLALIMDSFQAPPPPYSPHFALHPRILPPHHHCRSMTQSRPSFHFPPQQNVPALPGPQPGQKPMPPLPYPMARIERSSRVAHLRVRERRVKGDFRQEVDGRGGSGEEIVAVRSWTTRRMLGAERAGAWNGSVSEGGGGGGGTGEGGGPFEEGDEGRERAFWKGG